MKRILYVEDNEDNVFVLSMRLDIEGGFELTVAADGATGLVEARKIIPQLILMDVNLPDINGLEVTRQLKGDPLTASIPVIALTSNAMIGDRERALSAGCEEFESKPIDFDRLFSKIEILIGGTQG